MGCKRLVTIAISVVATDNEGAVRCKRGFCFCRFCAQPGNEAPTVSVALSATAVDVGGV
ncbi:hypothetical protein O9993_20865 [Vibrio lentus]|nr:hypothetical protein [Vibrio lentus]